MTTFADIVPGALLPHGYCFLWQPLLLWLHVVSDAIIAVAYYSIPLGLVYVYLRRRTDAPFNWLIVMFGAFIVLCGTTHVLGIINVWTPYYWLDGIVKAATALVSIGTAILLVPILPKLLKLPSPLSDGLTGIGNRLRLEERLNHTLAHLRRHRGERLALLFVDLDGFKTVNDSLGHSLGDDLLRAVARRLRKLTRISDTVVRIGGDEFVVLLDDVAGPAAAKAAAKRVILALEQPFALPDHTLEIGASVGIAMSDGHDDAEELLRRADRAMYHAKQRRSGYQLFDEMPLEAPLCAAAG